MSRRDGIWLAVLLMIQVGLVAFAFVPAPHEGGDNAGYVSLAHALLTGQGYTEVWDPARPAHTKYPPVFPLLLAGAMLAGARTWLTLKAVSLVAAVVTVGAVFLWVRRRCDARFAFLTALLTGLAPGLLHYSHFVLSDVPFVALVFLGLWAWEGEGAGEGGDLDRAGRTPRGWVVAATLLTLLAYFTRSAGLPLLLAGVGALLLQRRPRLGLTVSGALVAPALLWALRNRAVAGVETAYGSELLLLDPLQPDLGRAGPVDLVVRIVENAVGYGVRHLPDALLGRSGTWAAAVGVGVLALALVGWVRALRTPRVAELFVPLYAGVILLWPQIWSADRFALPLVPLVLYYALATARWMGTRWRRGPVEVVALAVGLTALLDLSDARFEARLCRQAVEDEGPWACGGYPMVDFTEAARWAGANLEAGTPVLSRKPRIWYLMSGIPSRTFPFTEEPGVLRREARALGARHVVLDFIGDAAVLYVGSDLVAAPQAYCSLGGFGGGPGLPPTRILGILGPGQVSGTRIGESDIDLAPCPPSFGPGVEPGGSPSRDGAGGDRSPADRRRWTIPLLEAGE